MLDSKIGEFLKIFRYRKKQFRCAYKNNRLTYSNFSVKALEEAKRFRSAVFVVDFEHVERTYLVCGWLRLHLYLWTDFALMQIQWLSEGYLESIQRSKIEDILKK